MKRTLLGTLWIGALAAGGAIALQMSGLLARPAAEVDRLLRLSPNEPVGFGLYLVVIAVSFGVAWSILQVTPAGRRAALLVLVMVELLGAAWVLHLYGVAFPPLPTVAAVLIAAPLAMIVNATGSGRRHRATVRLFGDRLAQSAHDRLAASQKLELSEPIAREATLVFCEIANEADLIDELTPAECAQLTREFIESASSNFLQEGGGYLHAADGEGIRVLFGFPDQREKHAADAVRAALGFRDHFRTAAAARPDSLGKIDLRIGISSGPVVATVQENAPGSEVVVAGEPLEVARRVARANRTYGSQILLGPRTFSAAREEIVARPIDFLRGSEAHDRLEVYELLGLAEKATPEEIARRDRFWTAIVYFRERRWQDSLAEFNRAKGEQAEQDQPLQWYLRRLEPLCGQGAEPFPTAQPLAPFS
ncbi:MAG: adenylate/guanylate cyclase domain-containing protein [Chthoniobacterales bacterium]|nr:adenylate/guanylate cyclase domain-containing protein [Chthoniobacterales bacterium]